MKKEAKKQMKQIITDEFINKILILKEKKENAKTEEEIERIYEKAAQYHDPFALFVSGMFCIRRNELDIAIERLTEAEQRGDVNSMNALGEIYSPMAEPHTAGEDVNIALQKFRKVLELRPNHAYALYNLALLYLNGCGVEKDVTKAHEFYVKAKSIDNGIPSLSFPGFNDNQTYIKYGLIAASVIVIAGISLSIFLSKRQKRKKWSFSRPLYNRSWAIRISVILK